MGRDPEASDGGISGRGILSFFVPTGSDSLPSEIQPAATRAIRSILDEAYAQASETLIAHLETLRRLAAYLVGQERVDGATFDELFDGRIEVPGAGDEWRAATSRPRAWADVVDLAGRRVRPPAEAAAVAATSPGDTQPPSTSPAAPAGGAVLTAEPAASAAATSGAPAIPAKPAIPAAGPAVAATLAAATPSPAPATIGAASPSAEGERHEERERHELPASSLRTGRLRLRGRRSTTRRVRSIAAGWLARAERWVRSSEPGADGL